MNIMKWVYYGFGGFIGFVCGVVINLIFFLLKKSGSQFDKVLVQNFGAFGRYLLELINWLPYIGLGLGFILVKLLFGPQFDDHDPPAK